MQGLVFRNKMLLDLSYIIWHMDSGYWFLFSIWIICMIFGISQYFSNTITKYKAEKLRIVYMGVFYFVGMILLFVLGYTFGLSFLGIKLTLYYMPFYFLGYLYGEFQSRLSEFKFINKKQKVLLQYLLWYGFVLL